MNAALNTERNGLNVTATLGFSVNTANINLYFYLLDCLGIPRVGSSWGGCSRGKCCCEVFDKSSFSNTFIGNDENVLFFFLSARVIDLFFVCIHYLKYQILEYAFRHPF